MANRDISEKEAIIPDLQRIIDLADKERVKIKVYITPRFPIEDSDDLISLRDYLEEQEIEYEIKTGFRAKKHCWEVAHIRFVSFLTGNQIEDLCNKDYVKRITPATRKYKFY